MYLKTTGFVIGIRNLFEKDKVIDIFTKEQGKIAVLGKGMQSGKSRLSGLIGYGNELQLDLFVGKSFYYINGCFLLQKMEPQNLWQQAVIFYWTEVLNKSLPLEEKNEIIYIWWQKVSQNYTKKEGTKKQILDDLGQDLDYFLGMLGIKKRREIKEVKLEKEKKVKKIKVGKISRDKREKRIEKIEKEKENKNKNRVYLKLLNKQLENFLERQINSFWFLEESLL